MKCPNANDDQRVVESGNQTPLSVLPAPTSQAVEDGKSKHIHQLSTCLRLRNHCFGGHGHPQGDGAASPGAPNGSPQQAGPEQYPVEIKDGSLLAQVLEVFADDGVVIESVTPADEPSPLERKYFGGQPMYLRHDLEVIWRNAYRRAVRLGLKPWQAERVAWRRVNKKSRAT